MMTKLDMKAFVLVMLTAITATAVGAQPALKIESTAGSRSVKATVANPSASACGVEVNFGDGREEKIRLEGREVRQIDHAYGNDGNFAVRLKGEVFVRGLRTALPCEVDETVQVRLATAALSQPAPGIAASSQASARPAATPSAAAPSTAPAVSANPPAQTAQPPVARAAGAGDDILVWRRSASAALEFVTGADGKPRLVSGEVLRWSGFDACWLTLPGHSRVLGGDGIQSVALTLMESTLASQVGGRPVRGRFVDCAPGGALQGDADMLLIQREALPLVRSRMPGFNRFELSGELSHASLAREAHELQAAQAQRAGALSAVMAEQQASEERQRRQALARQFPYTATLRCAGPSGVASTATCLNGRTLRAQLELANGGPARQFGAADLAQAGTETAQGLVIALRDRFTIEVQNVDETLSLTLRIVETATDQPVFERSAGRFEMLRASR